MQYTTGPIELERMLTEHADINIVTCATPEDFDKGPIPAQSMCRRISGRRFRGCNKDKVNVLYCYTQTCHPGDPSRGVVRGEGVSREWRWKAGSQHGRQPI